MIEEPGTRRNGLIGGGDGCLALRELRRLLHEHPEMEDSGEAASIDGAYAAVRLLGFFVKNLDRRSSFVRTARTS